MGSGFCSDIEGFGDCVEVERGGWFGDCGAGLRAFVCGLPDRCGFAGSGRVRGGWREHADGLKS